MKSTYKQYQLFSQHSKSDCTVKTKICSECFSRKQIIQESQHTTNALFGQTDLTLKISQNI